MAIEHSLWVEKYRPLELENYIGNEHLKSKVRVYLESGDMPHLLLFGRAGTGKTTLAKMLVNSIDCDYLYINASDENNVETVRTKVKNFASTIGFKDMKIIILDECDYITPNAQAALRNLMETFSKHCRFILTCNYVEKIIDPIQSRCQTFQIVPPSKKEVAVQLDKILKSEDINYDVKDLVPIIDSSYPDIRKVINTCQLNSVKGVLKLSKNDLLDSDFKTKIVDILKLSDDSRNKYMKIRQTVADSKVQDFTEMYSLLYDKVDEYASGKVSGVILVLAEGQHRDALAVDKEIPFMATILNILSTINK